MLKRIRIQGFKSLDDVEVELAPLVVLFGPNAAGKSNFLEALSLLSRLGTERTLADAFESPLRGFPAEAFTLPAGGLGALLQQDSARLAIEADIGPAPANGGRSLSPLRYRVGLRIKPDTGQLEVIDEYLQRLDRHFQPLTSQKPRIEVSGDHLAVRLLGEPGQPRQEPLGLNHTLLSNRQFSGENRYPDFDRLRAELGAWRSYYLDPRVAMRTPQPPRETTDIGPRGELIAPFLHRLKEDETLRRRFEAVTRGLRTAIPSIRQLDVDLDPKRGTLDVQIVQDDVPYSSRVISEGTLRVLALCAIAANPWPCSLVAFEEPENGVHPRRLDVVADLLLSMVEDHTRQVIVTTHSALFVVRMLKEAAISNSPVALYQVNRRGQFTEIRRFDTRFGSLFGQDEILKALSDPEDPSLISALFTRGWLDG